MSAGQLLDVLAVLEEEYLQLELTEALKPGILRPVPKVTKDEGVGQLLVLDYLCVLMPMQIV